MRDQVETRTFALSRNDVAAVDTWLEEIGARWGASERTIFGVRLCIAELAANAVEHGIVSGGLDHMVITIRRLRRGIGVEFLDSRAPFDPTTKPKKSPDPKSIEAAEPTGRGLRLLHAYANDLSYSHDGTYNRVRLIVNST